jgi:hypothetical protein
MNLTTAAKLEDDLHTMQVSLGDHVAGTTNLGAHDLGRVQACTRDAQPQPCVRSYCTTLLSNAMELTATMGRCGEQSQYRCWSASLVSKMS